MRPVNLIPLEERRGEAAPLRTGPTAYVLLGVLGIALLTITMLVMTGNGVKEREAELAALEAREQAASAAAASLGPYTQFAGLADARSATVTSLANSRFDWERVLRELSLIIPDDVWLTQITAGAASGDSGGSSSSLASSATGPILQFTGCAAGQKAVAAFAAALHDIDGVTRVGINSSQLGTGGAADASGGESGASGGCQTETVSSFEAVAAFDGVATDAVATAPETGTPATDPETAGAVAEQQQAKDSAAEQVEKGRRAANLAPGVDQ